ncbi:hypothetical protein OVA11_19405, partial [Caulobacter sp. SL161]|nr:hypothetical protein [Caulobacter sp. SL161]
IDLTNVYHDPRLKVGEVGLRFVSGMAFWCKMPLSPSSWFHETLEVWRVAPIEPVAPVSSPPDPFDPVIDDAGHTAPAWGAAITPQGATTPILDFVWLGAPGEARPGAYQFIGFDQGGAVAATLPLCQALAKSKHGASDPAAALSAMRQTAQAAIAPLTDAERTLALKVVNLLDAAARDLEPTTVEALEQLCSDYLDEPTQTFVDQQVTPATGLFSIVWTQLYAMALIGETVPAAATTCAFLAKVARGMSLIIGVNTADATLAEAAVRIGLVSALLRLPAPVMPPPPTTTSASGLGVGVQKTIDQTFEGYRTGEIAEIVSLLPGEELTRVDRHRALSGRVEDEATLRLSQDERITRDKTSGDLAQSLRDSLGQGEIIRDYTGLTFDEDAWPELAVTGSWFGQDGRQDRELSRAAKFVQTLSRQAAGRVSDQIQRARADVLVREQEATQTRRINNSDKTTTLNGAYHWLDRVDRLRLREVGRRLVLELLLDKPAAGTLSLLETMPHMEAPLPPSTWSIDAAPSGYTSVQASNYLSAAAAYGLELPAPPQAELTVSLRLDQQTRTGMLEVPPGYSVTSVSLAYLTANQASPLSALVGATPVTFAPPSPSPAPAPASPPDPTSQPTPSTKADAPLLPAVVKDRPGAETAATPPAIPNPQGFAWTLPTQGAGQGAATFTKAQSGPIPVVCQYDSESFSAVAQADCTAVGQTEVFTAWQIITHGAIVSAYDTLRARHDQAIRDALLGQAPDAVGRTLERALVLDGLAALGASAPRLNAALSASESRLLSEALDWNLASYAFYPWSQADNPGSANLGRRAGETTSDRNAPAWLEAFLTAGSARVLVTVRPGFEAVVLFFLAMGYAPAPAAGVFVTDLTAALLIQLQAAVAPEPDHEWSLSTPTRLLALSTHLDLLPEAGA